MKRRSHDLLLRHCLALDESAPRRAPAQARLELALGPDLARRLVSSLVSGERRL